MNTSQLLCVVSCDPILSKNIIGVFAADTLPRRIESGGFIANTDESQNPGKHWCAFYFDGNGRAEFFDSYGRPPLYYNKHFSTCLHNSSVVQIYNKDKLQNDFSRVCAQFSLYFFIHRLRGLSMLIIVQQLRKIDFKDQYVYDYISTVFPYCVSANILYNQTCLSLKKVC